MMHNNLFLNRLIVHTKDGNVAYDEEFHRGINIIRGDNSSGKSTISHFIFYVLGGAFNNWVKEAKKCSDVIAEVEMCGAILTLKRSVGDHTNAPIYIYWGAFSELLENKSAVWNKFGYSKTSERKSFSNVFFENLEIPIAFGDNNINMHQILRLLYVDQDSPTSSLFLYEQFDSQLNRITIADLLLGVYNQDLYSNRLELRDKESEFDKIKSEISGIRKFIGEASRLNVAHIKTEIANAQKNIDDKEVEIIGLKEQTKRVNFTKKTKLDFERINSEAINQRNLIKTTEEQLGLLKYEIDDTQFFIDSLEVKLTAIRKSIVTRKFLGEFQLDHCPECLSKIDDSLEVSTCKLCKNKVDDSYGVTQARKIEQELDFQIKESKKNIIRKRLERDDLEIKLDSERVKNNQIQASVNSALNDVKSLRSEKIDQLFIDKGYLEGEMMQLRTLLENAEAYENLLDRKDKTENRIKYLKQAIEIANQNQEKLKKEVTSAIKEFGVEFLRNDLYRQKEFKTAKEFKIDFRNNLAFLDDKELRFSASSDFYLKTTARFSLFFASLEVDSMRYPRFILCDNMEDKGIEEIRAQNFQKLIVNKAKEYDSNNFQLIYTTSFLPKELDVPSYTVGEFYTEASPSLKHV